MLRFKSFSSRQCDGDVTRLERLVNGWLEAANPHIQHMAQSSQGEHLVVSFLYDDMHGHVAVAAHEVAIPEVFEQDLQDSELDPAETPPLPDVELPY